MEGEPRGPTLNTNISPRKRATVLKLPSQMLGLAPGVAGRSPRGGRGGLGWRSCFLSDGEWILRTGSVGRGLVGSRGSAGGPGERGCILEKGQACPAPCCHCLILTRAALRQACHTPASCPPPHCLLPQSLRKSMKRAIKWELPSFHPQIWYLLFLLSCYERGHVPS